MAVSASLFQHYLAKTPYTERAHDPSEHIEYIDLVRHTKQIPGARDCWECAQPPLYYAVAGAWLTLGPRVGGNSEGQEVQALGALLGLLSLAAMLGTVATMLEGTYERLLAGLLLVFWPTLYTESAKVGNDTLLYFFASVALFELVLWRKTDAPRHFVLAALFAGLAPNAKASGFASVLVFLVSITARVVRPPLGRPRVPKGAFPATALLGACVALWFYILLHFRHGIAYPDLEALIADDPNDYWNFLPPTHFGGLTTPFQTWPTYNFWLTLFQTSLFGEVASENALTTAAAWALSGLGVVFVATIIVSAGEALVRARRPSRRGDLELLLTISGFIAVVVYFRLRFPRQAHNDFRFALPIVAPCAVLLARAFGAVRRRFARDWPHLAALPAGLVALFCCLAFRVILCW